MRSVSCIGGLKFRNASSHCLSDGPAFFDVPVLKSLLFVSSVFCVSRFLSISYVNVSHLELIRAMFALCFSQACGQSVARWLYNGLVSAHHRVHALLVTQGAGSTLPT